MRPWIVRLAAAAFAACFVAIIAIANRGEGDRWWGFLKNIPHGDKWGHLGLVGTLALLANLAVPGRRLPRPLGAVTWTTLVLLVLLTAEELAQQFQPYRNCDWWDWLADLAGLALGQTAAGLLLAWRTRARSPATGARS
jgi:hypothetical protein